MTIIIQLNHFYYCHQQGHHFHDGPLSVTSGRRYFAERAIMEMMALSVKCKKGGKFKLWNVIYPFSKHRKWFSCIIM